MKKIARIDAHIRDYLEAMDSLDESESDEAVTHERLQSILDDFEARKSRYESYISELSSCGETQPIDDGP